MNGVVREARQRAAPTRDEKLDLIGRRVLAKLFEDGSGLIAIEHFESWSLSLSNWQLAKVAVAIFRRFRALAKC
jgi:hypothetical protein